MLYIRCRYANAGNEEKDRGSHKQRRAAASKVLAEPQIDDRSRGKMSSAEIASEETTKSQPRSVKDICKLRNSDADFLQAHAAYC